MFYKFLRNNAKNDPKGQKVKTITQYLFSKTIGKFFCFLGLYISIIVNSQAAGFVDVSALSVSPSPVTISQNFNISFSLKEYQGDSKTFEYIEVWIQDGSRSDLYNVKRWDNIAFSANQSRDFSTTTFLDPARGRVPGTYYAVVRGKLTGSDPFNFGVVPGSSASNPYRFTAISVVGRVDASASYILSWDLWCAPQSETVGIGNGFDVRFALMEHQGGNKEFEYIEVRIQDGSGTDLYQVQQWPNEKFSPYEGKFYITNRTFLDPAKGRVPGSYRAIIRGKEVGGSPFNFDGLIGGVNPKTFTAVQRDGLVGARGSQASGTFTYLKPFSYKIQQGQNGYLGVALLEGIPQTNNGGCGSTVLEYIETWIQDSSGNDLWRLNRWDNVSFTYGQEQQFNSDIFIDPNKYKLGTYKMATRGKYPGAAPFTFNELSNWYYGNEKFLLEFEVLPPSGTQDPPYTCKTLESGLNTCILSPGDILFHVWKHRLLSPPDVARMVGGTYWFHTGIYLGDGLIAEAAGAYPKDRREEVRTISIDNSDWAKTSTEGLLDWSVIRPIASQTTKNAAVNYARSKADQGNDGNEPPILFQEPLPWSDKNAEDKFYCAQMAWKSYEKQGLNLETREIMPPPETLNIVTPDDLYYSANNSSVLKSHYVAQKPNINRRVVWRVFSPVDLLLVDEQGRRTGFDTTTGTILDEIPGTTYTGPESEPEAITTTGVEGNLKLYVVGNKDGQYTLEAVDLDLNNIRNQVITRNTTLGKVEIYEVVTGGEQLLIPPNRPPVAQCRNVTISANGSCQASTSVNNGSYDPDGDPITLMQIPAGPYGLGTTGVTLTATDSDGASASCSATVTVVDTMPPTITSVTASPNTLWPPNHKMVPVQVTAATLDNCIAAPVCKITAVSSNEPVNGTGDGDTAPDWQITGDLTVNLRAERSGSGSGRVYSITIQCADAAGNSSPPQLVTTVVPHAQGKK